MRTKNSTLATILFIMLLAFSREAIASSGNPITRIYEWKPMTEILEYHSCGTADMCWIAEVKSKKTKKRIAMLRCDSEQLFSKIGERPEEIAATNCKRFETEDKFREIPSALRALLNR